MEKGRKQQDSGPSNWRAGAGASAGGGGSSSTPSSPNSKFGGSSTPKEDSGFSRFGGGSLRSSLPEVPPPLHTPATPIAARDATPAAGSTADGGIATPARSTQVIRGLQGVLLARRHDLAQVRLVGGDSLPSVTDVRVLPSQLADGTEWTDLEVGGEVKLDVVKESFGGNVQPRFSAAQLSLVAAGTVSWVHSTQGGSTLRGVVIAQPSGLLTQDIATDAALAALASESWRGAHPLAAVAPHSGVPQATSDWCAAHFSDQSDGGQLASLPRKGLLSPAIALGTPPSTREAAPGALLVLEAQGTGVPQWAAAAVGSVLQFGVEHVSDEQGRLPLPGDVVQFHVAADSRTAEVWAHAVRSATDFGAALVQAAEDVAVQSTAKLQLGTVVTGAACSDGGFRGAAQVQDGRGGQLLLPLVAKAQLKLGERVPVALAVLDSTLPVSCASATGVCDTAPAAVSPEQLLAAATAQGEAARKALQSGLPSASAADWHSFVHWQPVAVAMPGAGAASGPVAVLATAALGVLASPLHGVRMPTQRALASGRMYSAPARADTVTVQDGGVVHVPLSQLTVRGACAAVAAAVSSGLVQDAAALCATLGLEPAAVSAAASLDASLASHLKAYVSQAANGRLVLALPLHEGMLATPDVALRTGDVLSLPLLKLDTEAGQATAALQVHAAALACPRAQRYSGVVCRVKGNFAFLRPIQEQPTVAATALGSAHGHSDIAVFLPLSEVVGTPDRSALAAVARRTPASQAAEAAEQPTAAADDDEGGVHDPLDLLRKGHALSGAPVSLSTADVKSGDGSFGVALGDVVTFDVEFVKGAHAADDGFRVAAARAVVESRVAADAKAALAGTAPSLDLHALLKGKGRKQFRQLGSVRHAGRLVKLSGAGQHAVATVHVQLAGDALAVAKGALAAWPGAGGAVQAPQYAEWDVASALTGPAAAAPARVEGAGEPLLDMHARQFAGASWFARVHGGAAGALLGSSTGALAPWEVCSTAAAPSSDVAALLQSVLVDPAVSRVALPAWAVPADGLWKQVAPGHAGTSMLATQCMLSAACAAYGLVLAQSQSSCLLQVPSGWRSSAKAAKGSATLALLEGVGAVTGAVVDSAAAAALSGWFCIPLGMRGLHGSLEGTIAAKARLAECSGIGRAAAVDAMQVNDWLTAADGGVPCTAVLSRDEVTGAMSATAVKLAPLPKEGGESWGEAGAWDVTVGPPAAAAAAAGNNSGPLPLPPAGRAWAVVAQVHTKASGRRGKKAAGGKPHAWLTPLNRDGSDGAPRSVYLALEDFSGNAEQLAPGRFVEYSREEHSDAKRPPNAKAAQLLPKALAGQLRAARKAAEPAPATVSATKPALVSGTVYVGRITREPSAPRAEGGGFFGGGRRGAGKPTPYTQYTGACVEVQAVAEGEIKDGVLRAVARDAAMLTEAPPGEADASARKQALDTVRPGELLEFPVAHCAPAEGGYLPAVVAGDQVAFVIAEGGAGAAHSASGWARTGAASARSDFSARAVSVVSPQTDRRTRHVGIVVALPANGRGNCMVQEITPVPKELRLDVAKRLAAGSSAVPALQQLGLSAVTLDAAVAEAAKVAASNGLWIPTRDGMVKLPVAEILPHLQAAAQVGPVDVTSPPPLPLSQHFLGDRSAVVVSSAAHSAQLQEGDVVEYSQIRVGREYKAVRAVPTACHDGRVPITILHQGATGITPPAPAAADTLVRHVMASSAVPVAAEDSDLVASIAGMCGVISLGNGRIGGVIAKRRGETALDMRGAQTTSAAASTTEGRTVQVSTVKSALQSATSGIGGASVPVQQANGPTPDSIGFTRVRSTKQQ